MKTEPNHESRVQGIFLRALEIQSEAERRGYLEGACGDDAALRDKVEALLKSHVEDSFLEQAAIEGAETLKDAENPLTEGPGAVIGRYKLLQQIGEGGMGVVYMAEQTEPVTRKVALKIIKLGMDTKQVVARFEAERQALAMMDHPNIAKVLDAGATEPSLGVPPSGGPDRLKPELPTIPAGRPYFVMELVRGVPITEYCDKNKLSTRQRLELFVKVCQAIQHAHQKGIIHRDIKPSNVMVTLNDGMPHPMVIDFGIAKATNQKLTEKTLFTNYAQMIGTPAYMSPEQAEMSRLDVDTRTDVYSLGVLLYELLTGTTPFPSKELLSLGYGEMQKVIVEKEPPKPSTRMSTMQNEERTVAARNRSIEASALGRLFRGDIDWIVMKALEKDRSHRYETVNGLATDIELHLQDRPITACRPSVIGRARRFVRRNKMSVALTTLVLLACFAAVSLGVVAHIGRLKQHEQSLVIQQAKAQEERTTWARQTAMPAVKQLVEDGHLVHAFLLAKEVKAVLPNDPAFQELWDSFTVTVTFDLKPDGTKVFFRDWDGRDDDWLEIGETPLRSVTLPNRGLRFRYVKEGHLTREFDRKFPEFLEWDGPVRMKEDPGFPEDMVFIDAVQSSNWNNLPTDLGDFLIDRYEVSNRQFQDFVDAGGYEQPEFWEDLEFTHEGETLSWSEAVQRFRDETGSAGPAGWRNGRFPEEEADYPVRGVSWFEAAAYARFAGKRLPTIYHWQWATDGMAGHTIALSNFSNRRPAPKGSHQGIGRFDVYDMAGNVKEWCWNKDTRDRRCLRGGAWNEASYQGLYVDIASPWDRSETHGFRCVRYLSEDAPPPATLDPWRRKLPHLAERERLPLESLEPWYQYDKDQPLNPKIIETGNHSPAEYRHEVIQIDAAYNNEQFDVHLFYPREKREKYETVLFIPGAGAWLSQRFGSTGITEWELIPRLIQSGRAVCLPVCKGMFERGDGTFPVPKQTIQTRDLVLAAAKDLARTIDYLRTRSDLDPSRLVFLGYSSGAAINLPVLSLHPGLRAAVLVSGAYPPLPPNTSNEVFYPYHFAPHVKLPVLMINGGLDTLFPYQTLQAPLFEDLGSENKKHVLLESGHNPPNDEAFDAADEWLRELFGAP